jgi:hypothetical protein
LARQRRDRAGRHARLIVTIAVGRRLTVVVQASRGCSDRTSRLRYVTQHEKFCARRGAREGWGPPPKVRPGRHGPSPKSKRRAQARPAGRMRSHTRARRLPLAAWALRHARGERSSRTPRLITTIIRHGPGESAARKAPERLTFNRGAGLGAKCYCSRMSPRFTGAVRLGILTVVIYAVGAYLSFVC